MNDLINRSTLLERFKKLKGVDTLANMFISDVIKEIKRLPAEHNNGWIPCSERMPEEKVMEHPVFDPSACRTVVETQMISDTMNVTVRNKHDQTVFVSDDCTTNGKWFNFDGEYYEVIAWQPLPEPYREENEHE